MEKNQRISFELLSHNEIDKFQEFIRDYYRNNHLFANETSVFDWQHKGSQSYHCMIAKEGEVIVGVQGVIPLNHFDNNLPKTQIFFALWRAIENHDVGIGLRLYMACINEYSPEFTASIGINDRAIPFHKWQGFNVTKMDHHVVLSPYVAFGIMPLFALANAGVVLNNISINTLLAPVPLGILCGLFFGKQIVVFLFSFLSIKLKLAEMPSNSNWTKFYGVGILTGIGFTMSLFVGNLAFVDYSNDLDGVKIGVLAGSFLSATVGYFLLLIVTRKNNS